MKTSEMKKQYAEYVEYFINTVTDYSPECKPMTFADWCKAGEERPVATPF